MNKTLRVSEKGQTVFIVAIMMVAFAAMLMLILDGGFAYMSRRKAQNAADAGALAGVTEICSDTPNYTAATNLAKQYAVTRNGSEPDKTFVTYPGEKVIQVQTAIDFPASFAQVITGQTELSVTAQAVAECGVVSAGEGVIPAAFPCVDIPVTDPPTESDSPICMVKFGDPNYDYDESFFGPYVEQGETNWPEMVIMLNSDADEMQCIENGGDINCDPDGDGFNNILDSGSKAWLNLNGGPLSTDELLDWIENGYHDDEHPLFPGLWIPDRPGVNVDIMDALRDLEHADPVLVPIFNSLCKGDNPMDVCPALWQEDDEVYLADGSGHIYYRIVGFGLFQVVCIYEDGDIDKGRCPYRDYLNPILGKNMDVKTIEGYFVPGSWVGETGDDAYNHGVYWYWLRD